MTQKEFGAVTLYNPQLLTPEELRRNFVVRRDELTQLLAELASRAEGTPQHHLVLAQPGMGKTTLLHTLAHEVEADPHLRQHYISLLFPEEQYNIRSLGDLWLNCLDALADALERAGDEAGAAEVDAIVEGLPLDEEARLEDLARDALLTQARQRDTKLLLLLDNADDIFGRIDEGDWALRQALQAHPEIVIIAAGGPVVESTYQYEAAFFDFFATMRLDGLDREEAGALLMRLAEEHRRKEVAEVVSNHPERIEPIRLLSGGNPRTMVALYEVLVDDSGSVATDLAVLLDRYTPWFKARFDALSPQAQTVVDALCLNWDPATAAELAERTGHGVNKVSAQLDRLVGSGLVEKRGAIDPKTGARRRRRAFQVGERLFNIWYLVRSSRRARRRLGHFLRVLEMMYLERPAAVGPTSLDELERVGDDVYLWALLHEVLPRHAGTISGAAMARDQLDALNLRERLRPAREALHAVAIGEVGVLDSLAPEVAEAARTLLEQWGCE